MFIEDGSNYSYSLGKEIPFIYSCGWLKNSISSNGWKDEEFKKVILQKLKENKNYCYGKRGYHRCEICGKDMGSSEIWIHYNNKIYVSPNDVAHYIEEHNYKPNQEVILAILLGDYLSSKMVTVDFSDYNDVITNYDDALIKKLNNIIISKPIK